VPVTRPHVLIVGGGGVFGSRLARLLARRHAYRISLGGRDPEHVLALQRDLRQIDGQGEFAFVHIDRQRIGVERLREIACQVVVDCTGPFASGETQLIEAAIGARCHYVDLADSRAFVDDIGRFDSAARAVAVAIVTGASTTPLLTHAVVEAATPGWLGIDSIDVAIIPGNRTPKGRAVVRSILGWVGQPVRVFRDGGWREGRGWTGRRTVKLEGVSPRTAMLAELPDLSLMVSHFRPRLRAQSDAGMELEVLNGLIGFSGLLVRLGLVRSARVFTGLGLLVANALDRFGTAEGGMLVEIAGQDSRGEARVVRWSLVARNGDGPYVPVAPAAAMIEALVFRHGMRAGARPASGLLKLEQIRPWFDGLAIGIGQTAYRGEKPLFRRVLGEAFDRLPAVNRNLHRGRPAIIAEGEALVATAENPLARFFARRFGLPTEAGRLPLRVTIESRDGREHWTRSFDGHLMRSVLSGTKSGLLEEQFGPFTMQMRLVPRSDGLDMHRAGGRLWGVPLPGWLLPKIKAEERVDEVGRHRFDVEITLPLLGRLVAYRGYLVI